MAFGQVYLYPIRTPLSPSYPSIYEHDWPLVVALFFCLNTVSYPCHPMSRHQESRAETDERRDSEWQRNGGRKRSLSTVSGGVSGCDLGPLMLLPTKPQRLAALAMPVLSPMTPSSARSSRRLTNGGCKSFPLPTFPASKRRVRGGMNI